jgi:hypothetical protein
MEFVRRLERNRRSGAAGNPHAGSLEPQTPADMADLFGMICDDLGRRIAGCDEVVRALALLATRHLAGHELLRCLVLGEPGSGKTRIVEALAIMSKQPKIRPTSSAKAAVSALRFEAEFTPSGKLLLRTVIPLTAPSRKS